LTAICALYIVLIRKTQRGCNIKKKNITARSLLGGFTQFFKYDARVGRVLH